MTLRKISFDAMGAQIAELPVPTVYRSLSSIRIGIKGITPLRTADAWSH
jgi:hypothetical protein